MVDNKLLPKLSQNLLEILDDEEYYDITIEVGNDPDKNDETLVHIKLPNILPEIFNVILRYIYGGKLSLEEYDVLDIIKILVAANELNLQELFPYLETFLIENKTSWMEQNFDLVYRTSFENNSFLQLQKYCTDLIIKEPIKIFNSSNFSSISEKLFTSLIQNKGVQISEVQVWEHMIKWGIAQNPELPSKIESYSKNDFKTLKNTLQQCIPLIRFHDLTSKEFSEKVLPYKKVFPKELYKSLLKDFLNNDRKPIEQTDKLEQCVTNEVIGTNLKNVDSMIITFQHVELISKWIDGLEYMDKTNNSYEFKLIFRASRDGFNPKDFHIICDNQSRTVTTVTIIKVKDSDEILGGYNPIGWKSNNSFGITKSSFIFSFKNNNNILSRVINDKKAINNNPYNGPSFGTSDINLFIFFGFLRVRCVRNNYKKLIRENDKSSFVEDFEVFQIS
ncbi:carbohydrate-binding module family 13 protein [Rhizophagus clarus]|uniref:Carbohydrate-binding module family 13 protein n=1 Tax=Rhizophagus clarus TaxID=94130 RepID=A0A8H3QE19_9GLOM|nr:carbohydrate-binding module family 13 protein [Rhizophagus clarus]